MDKKVLIVVTSNDKKGDTGQPTGYYLSEVSHPWDILNNAGYEIDFVSPKGGKAPVDALNLEDPINKKFWNDTKYRKKIENTLKPSEINTDDYSAIIYAGGHGTMWDFADNKELAKIGAEIYEKDGIVSAVCHGPSALVNIKLSNGKYLVDGKKINAFTNEEEVAVGLDKIVPFLLESKLKERGAIFEKSGLWQKHVTVDQRVVTGQNPQSAKGIGEAVLKILKQNEEFSFMIILEINPEYREEFKKRITINVNSTNHEEKDNIQMIAYQDEKDLDKIYIFEKWSKRSALEDIHKKKSYYKEVQKMYQYLKKPAEIIYLSDIVPMDSNENRKKIDAIKNGYAKVLFIDTKEGKGSDFAKLYKSAIAEFRNEPGIILYQIFIDKNDSTKFITHEVFKNEADFNQHSVLPSLNPIIDFLNNSIKEQPFQKNLHTLIPFAPTVAKYIETLN